MLLQASWGDIADAFVWIVVEEMLGVSEEQEFACKSTLLSSPREGDSFIGRGVASPSPNATSPVTLAASTDRESEGDKARADAIDDGEEERCWFTVIGVEKGTLSASALAV